MSLTGSDRVNPERGLLDHGADKVACVLPIVLPVELECSYVRGIIGCGVLAGLTNVSDPLRVL